jgi:dihydroorotate dehydrogenase (NAD+) catalytic subunit
MNPDLSVQLGSLHLKNPLICASSEFTMTEAGIRSALDAGAAAVIAKSVNESPQAAHQLDTAEYVLLDDNWQVLPWNSAHTSSASLFCRSGMAKTPLSDWIRGLCELDRYARTKDAYVMGSITMATVERAIEIAAQMESAGLRCIELNLSAPHGREVASSVIQQITDSEMARDCVKQVRQRVRVPLAVKLTSQTDLVTMAKAVADAGADMLVMTGRSQGFMPDIETFRPVWVRGAQSEGTGRCPPVCTG